MGFLGDISGGILGSTSLDEAAGDARRAQTRAAQKAIATQQAASAEAQAFLAPFGAGTEGQPGIAQQGLELAPFIGDQQAQFDFLQGNPLFQLALDNANQQTQKVAAAGGRLSAGDTLQQLSNNVLLQASPLIRNQAQDIFGLLGIGQQGVANQANAALGLGSNVAGLQTDIGSAEAAGQIARGNAKSAASGQALALLAAPFTGGASLAGGFGGGGGGAGGFGTNPLSGTALTPGGFGAGGSTAGLLPLPF